MSDSSAGAGAGPTSGDRGSRIRLDASWRPHLEPVLESPKLVALGGFLRAEKKAGKAIYPPGPEIFAAFDATPFDQVKVVILGQDPYHGPDQAHGLAFSVRPGVAVPPSLANVFAEQRTDVGITLPDHGYLIPWARQGVLLLNDCLTVERGRAGAHRAKGWEELTDAAIAALAGERDGLVFLLWGSPAQKKGRIVDRRRHLVLTAPHPSPLSAHRGFFGCGHFSRSNAWLRERGASPIEWQLPARAELDAAIAPSAG